MSTHFFLKLLNYVYSIFHRTNNVTCAAAVSCIHRMRCDTVSSFHGKGKKTAFESWKAASDGDLDRAMKYLEKFVVTMYDR